VPPSNWGSRCRPAPAWVVSASLSGPAANARWFRAGPCLVVKGRGDGESSAAATRVPCSTAADAGATQLIAASGWRPIAALNNCSPWGNLAPLAAFHPSVVPSAIACWAGMTPWRPASGMLGEGLRTSSGTLRVGVAQVACPAGGRRADRRPAGKRPAGWLKLRSAR